MEWNSLLIDFIGGDFCGKCFELIKWKLDELQKFFNDFWKNLRNFNERGFRKKQRKLNFDWSAYFELSFESLGT